VLVRRGTAIALRMRAGLSAVSGAVRASVLVTAAEWSPIELAGTSSVGLRSKKPCGLRVKPA
jgi:hypothetical protein